MAVPRDSSPTAGWTRERTAKGPDGVSVEHSSVVLYSRHGCHLCERALELLTAHGLVPHVVDIDDDPRLRERFDTCVPVVEMDGRVRFRGVVDPRLLRRIIERRGS